MSTTIYLVRHAEAEGNIGRRCHGHYDSMLTRRGLMQAEVVGKRFAETYLDAVYSSDLWRARHTAMAIARPHRLPVHERPALREIYMGDWEDEAWAALPIGTPELYDIWCTRPWECRPPHGETIMEAGARALAEMRRIAREEAGHRIALVCHGSAIRGILTLALGLRAEDMMQVGWGDNTCVAKMIFHTDGSIDVPYRNDNSHLPEELSTFVSLKWSDDKDVPASPQMWFRPVDPDEPADRDAYLTLAGEMHLGESEAQLLERLAAYRAVTPNAVAFGMVDHEIGGIVSMDTTGTGDIGVLDGVSIAERFRGFGFGPQLTTHAVCFYRRLGKRAVEAEAANARAIRFYQDNDFTRYRARNGRLILRRYIATAE